MGVLSFEEGGEWGTSNLPSHVHYALKGLVVGGSAAPKPHWCSWSGCLDRRSIWWAWGSHSLYLLEKRKMLLGFFGQWCSVVSLGEILCNIHTQEFGAAHLLHSSVVDGQQGVLGVASITISLVFLTFRKSMLSLHHVASWLWGQQPDSRGC